MIIQKNQINGKMVASITLESEEIKALRDLIVEADPNKMDSTMTSVAAQIRQLSREQTRYEMSM